jgi:hypothetical protein
MVTAMFPDRRKREKSCSSNNEHSGCTASDKTPLKDFRLWFNTSIEFLRPQSIVTSEWLLSAVFSEPYLANDLATRFRSGVWILSGRNAINAPRSLQHHFTAACSTRYAYKRPNANPSSRPAPISPGILFIQISKCLSARRRRLFALGYRLITVATLTRHVNLS